jgi:hypothetical protein
LKWEFKFEFENKRRKEMRKHYIKNKNKNKYLPILVCSNCAFNLSTIGSQHYLNSNWKFTNKKEDETGNRKE